MRSKLSCFTTEASTGGRFKKRDAVEFMAKEGSVEWEGAGKATAIVYWRKPEGWANVICEWLIMSARLWQE